MDEATNEAENPTAPTKLKITSDERIKMKALKINFYELLIRQLLDDNFHAAAELLEGITHISPNRDVSDEYLFNMFERSAFTAVSSSGPSITEAVHTVEASPWSSLPETHSPNSIPSSYLLKYTLEPLLDRGNTAQEGVEPKQQVHDVPPTASFNLRSHHTLRLEALCAAASPYSEYMACGGVDSRLYVLDIPKHNSDNQEASYTNRNEATHKFKNLRVFEDHKADVTAVTFHPTKHFCVSGSADYSVKLFDIKNSSQSSQIAVGSFQDLYRINTLCFHPCGDFLYVGTDHPVIRLYDLQTQNCYSTLKMDQNHTRKINDVRCTSDGSIVASASDDGTVKLWDGVSFKLANSIPNAHRRFPVKSVRWSHSGRYIVTSGLDGQIRVWDIRNGKEVIVMGRGNRSAIRHCCAALLYDETYIVYTATENNNNPSSTALQLYNALDGSWLASNNQFHWSPINSIEAVPNEVAIVTSGSDRRCCLIDVKPLLQS